MNPETLLNHTQRLFLDTAPIIYYVEKHPSYFAMVRPIFDRIDQGKLTMTTSPITLAECLVHPYQMGHLDAVQIFSELLTNQMHFVWIDETIATRSAELRAHYHLHLPDALQIAVALHASCDAFLTNDKALKQVTELRILVVDELWGEQQ